MDQPEDNETKSGMKGQAQGLFEWWNELSTILPEDTVLTMIKRVLIRIIGIVLLIIFSPLLLLAFLIIFFIAL